MTQWCMRPRRLRSCPSSFGLTTCPMAALRLALATGLATPASRPALDAMRSMVCLRRRREVVRCRLNDLSISTAQTEVPVRPWNGGGSPRPWLRQMTGLDRPEAASLASSLLADPVPRRSIARLGGWQGLLPPAAGPGGPVGLPPQAGSGSGLDPPPPPSGRDPRRAKTGQNPALFGPNFSGFLPPCGAAPRGGGGAPPTTLILLRNHRAVVASRPARSTAPWDPVRGLLEPKKSENHRSFFADVVCLEDEVGCGDRLRRCGRRPGPAGPASPIAEVSDRRDGGLPAAPTQLARS